MKKPAHWPRPADPEAAARLQECFSVIGKAEARFAKSTAGRAILDAFGGNAPYLADLAIKEPATLRDAVEHGPSPTFRKIIAGLHAIKPTTPRRDLAQKLRKAKARAALTIAYADIGGIWPLAEITAALSELAQTALRVAIRHLLTSLHDAKTIKLPHPDDPEQNCGFVALALGKLGAGELNYSSDIDLVLLYDSENPVYPASAQPLMARLARDLVGLLSARDEHGYVFRVDLRLRPDPAATPPVVSLTTALTYYESHGRTWERAAFSKARPIAGDLSAGDQFLAAIRPFIWRKHLDFAAVADIHGMKRQIDAAQKNAGLLGFDVKLGRGGIREIEFLAQTLSLVWGGQNFLLRIPQTLKALHALARAGHLPDATARDLSSAYQTLRKVEHRLQMVDDRQTHELPATEAALKAFQQKNGLAVDGVAGPDTFTSLGLGELVLLALGTTGATVKKLQEALGVPADGQFGPATEKAVLAFQSAHGLEADGIAGPNTLIKIPAFAGQISAAQVTASAAPEAASKKAATLPSLDPKAPAQPAPAKSIWSTVKGWL